MRCIGGHDLYDGAAAAWHDDLVWNRGEGKPDREQGKVLKSISYTNARETYAPKGSRPRILRADRIQLRKQIYAIHYPILYLCGTIYRGIRLNTLGEELYFWQEDAFEAWLEKKELGRRRAFGGQNYPFLTRTLTSEEEQPFLDAGIVLAWTTHRSHDPNLYWQVNTVGLKDLEIGKLMPASEIAQELIRYIGSRMIEPDPAKIKISDDIRLAKHSMDKTSFRKPAGNKKRGQS